MGSCYTHHHKVTLLTVKICERPCWYIQMPTFMLAFLHCFFVFFDRNHAGRLWSTYSSRRGRSTAI